MCTQLACQLLHKHGGQGSSVFLSPDILVAVASALNMLKNSKPRQVSGWSLRPPILVFTDGAAEEEQHLITHGAVLIDPMNNSRLFFGDHVPSEILALWKRHGKKQVISQAEMLPVLVAKLVWSEALTRNSVLCFLENESARTCFVRNYSPVLDNFFMLQFNGLLDMSLDARHWYSRVPSRSNISDAASRL